MTSRDALLVRIDFPDPRSLFCIVERIRAMFDFNADWASIVKTLRPDPALTASIHAEPGLRVPGSWNGFELAVRAILGQQVTVKGATLLAGRIASTFGKPFAGPAGLTRLFPSAETLAERETDVRGTYRRARRNDSSAGPRREQRENQV